MLSVFDHPGLRVLAATSLDDADRLRVATRQAVAQGERVNVLFQHDGARHFVSSVLPIKDGFFVGRGALPALERGDCAAACDAALRAFDEAVLAITDPAPARSGRK